MKATMRKAALLGAAGLFFLFLCTGSALSQTYFQDYKIGGEIEAAGGISIDDDDDDIELGKGYLDQYGELPDGPFGNIEVFALSNDDSRLYELTGTSLGQDDQTILFRTTKLGKYSFEFEWWQLSRLYSNGYLWDDGQNLWWVDDDIDVEWKSARFGFLYSPLGELDIVGEYRYINKDGDIPSSVTVPDHPYVPSRVLRPIEYDNHNVSVAAEWAKPMYVFRLAYNLSKFENDNVGVKTGIQAGDYLSLPPDNVAHYITAAGGFNLPFRTRVNASFSYGWLMQNDTGMLASDPGIEDSIMPSFGTGPDIDINTMLYYISATSRPIDPLTLSASYRFYKYDDDEDYVNVAWLDEPSIYREHRSPYEKHNASIEGKYQFECWVPAVLNVGYRFERWDRHWEEGGGDTNTHTPRVALTITPIEWWNVSGAYSHSSREGDDYSSFNDEPIGFKRFNQADRERDAFSFISDVTAMGNLTLTGNFTIYRDRYDDSIWGITRDKGWSAGGDVSWTPMNRLALSLGYLHEYYDIHQRVDPGLPTDHLNSEVEVDPGPYLRTEDTFDTFTAGVNIAYIPGVLTQSARYSYSIGKSEFNNSLGPDLENKLHRLETYLKYQFLKCWYAKVGYVFEDYDSSDEYTSYVDDVVESYDLYGLFGDETAHIAVIALGYKF